MKNTIIALLLVVPAWVGGQSANQPEVLSGTAQIKNATGAMSGTLEVRLRRVTPEFDRKAEVAVLEIRIDGKGAGTGSMAAAARMRPDGDGGVMLDDFAENLITLTDIARKPS